MPLIGLGVWQIPARRATEQAVAWALEAGYRHVDTAAAYRNEEGVGGAVRASVPPARGGLRDHEDDALGRGSGAGARRQPGAAGARLRRPLPHPLAHAGERRLLGFFIAAATSGLDPFIRVAITFERHAEAIANAIWLGTNNARLEAMNSTVRLMSHRARGFRRLQSLLSLITLCAAGSPWRYPRECPKRLKRHPPATACRENTFRPQRQGAAVGR